MSDRGSIAHGQCEQIHSALSVFRQFQRNKYWAWGSLVTRNPIKGTRDSDWQELGIEMLSVMYVSSFVCVCFFGREWFLGLHRS